VILLLIWLAIMFVWDLWNEVLTRWVVPKSDSLTGKVIIGPLMKFFLSWIRFPNYSDAMPLGDLRDGETTCLIFNVPTLSMATGGTISLASIIYALWVAGIFFYILQYIAFLIMIIPTAYFYGAQSTANQDADLDMLEEELTGLEDIPIEVQIREEENEMFNASEVGGDFGHGREFRTYTNPSDGPVIYYVPDHHKGE